MKFWVTLFAVQKLFPTNPEVPQSEFEEQVISIGLFVQKEVDSPGLLHKSKVEELLSVQSEFVKHLTLMHWPLEQISEHSCTNSSWTWEEQNAFIVPGELHIGILISLFMSLFEQKFWLTIVVFPQSALLKHAIGCVIFIMFVQNDCGVPGRLQMSVVPGLLSLH